MSARNKLLIGCATVIGVTVIICIAATAWWLVQEHSRKEGIAKAIENKDIEISQVLTNWSCPPGPGKDDHLVVTIWVRNNSPVRLNGLWVFNVSLDHSRLDMDCWRETFKDFA